MFRANHPALLTLSPLPRALRAAATTPTAPVDGPHPRDLPENQYSYRPPPQRPSSQPPPAPPTFHVTHPLIPFSSADSHSGFAALSHATRVLPFLPHFIPIHPPEFAVVFLFPSLSPSPGLPIALWPPSCHYPFCFSFLVPSSFSSPAPMSFLRYPSLTSPPLSVPTRHAPRFSFPRVEMQTRPTTPIEQTIL